jgi:hypothetical protein
MKKYFLLAWLILTIGRAAGQGFASPSLSVGVGKVLYEKGSLDAALIAEIIATKQDEAKRELTKRWIQNSISGGSYVVKNFISKNLEILLSGSSAEVVKKEMLKNAAELALVLGIAEFYLQDMHQRCNLIKDYSNPYPPDSVISKEEIDFLLDYGRSLDPKTRMIFFCDFFIGVKDYSQSQVHNFSSKVDSYTKSLGTEISDVDRLNKDMDFYEGLPLEEKIILSIFYFNIRPFSKKAPLTNWNFEPKLKSLIPSSGSKLARLELDVSRGISGLKDPSNKESLLPDPVLLSAYKNKASYSSERKGRTKFWSPNHMLLDLVFVECIESKPIKQLGFFHNLSANKDEIQDMNMMFRNDNRAYFLKFIQETIKKKIDYVFSNYAIFSALGEVKNLGDNAESIIANEARVKDLMAKVRIAISNVRHGIENYSPTQEEKEAFENLYRILIASHDQSMELNDQSNYLKNQVLPLLASINLKTNSAYEEIQTILLELSKAFQGLAIAKLEDKICDGTPNCLVGEFKKYESYIQLAQTVGKLDKVETYDKIIKFISDIGGIYSDRGVGAVVNSFVNAYDKYVIVIKEENRLQIDVEAAAVDLYERYTKNSRSNFGLLFTVGVNYAHQNYLMPFDEVTGERKRLENDITFVGEKIGLKYRMWNYTKRKSMGYQASRNYNKSITSVSSYSSKPFVTDIHAIGYGSGLLYKISELNSNSGQLSKPIAGLSVGVSFFNGLDLNAGVAAEIGLARNLFYNISFDINFTEYLTALRKKKSN